MIRWTRAQQRPPQMLRSRHPDRSKRNPAQRLLRTRRLQCRMYPSNRWQFVLDYRHRLQHQKCPKKPLRLSQLKLSRPLLNRKLRRHHRRRSRLVSNRRPRLIRSKQQHSVSQRFQPKKKRKVASRSIHLQRRHQHHWHHLQKLHHRR